MGGPVDAVMVAGYNLHVGVDGWARPYDVVEACRAIDADVLVLQENWTGESEPSLVDDVAEALGYSVLARTLASGRRAVPHPDPGDGWGRAWRGPYRVLFLDSERPLPTEVTSSLLFHRAQRGEWGLALLSRRPVMSSDLVDLGRPRRDRVRRAALAIRIEIAGRPLTVVGTHMPHPSIWSPATFRLLARALPALTANGPAVLVGDMNLWGPPVGAFFPGWTRVVRGRTWPSWKPHSQVDHILVHGGAHAEWAGVLRASGSDHRPVGARITVR